MNTWSSSAPARRGRVHTAPVATTTSSGPSAAALVGVDGSAQLDLDVGVLDRVHEPSEVAVEHRVGARRVPEHATERVARLPQPHVVTALGEDAGRLQARGAAADDEHPAG